jgi:hypothetical protein
VHENRNAIGDLDHAAASVAVQRIGTAASGIQSSSVKFCIGNNPARFASVVTYQNAILRAHDPPPRSHPLF